MALFGKPPVVTGGAAGGGKDDGEWGRKYPALVEFLTLTEWEPGKPRLPGSIILFSEDGAFKACLSCKDTNAVAFKTARTVQELLKALEVGLASGALDWRPSKSSGGRGPKRS